VNLAPAGLANGAPFEIRDAQDYFGTPVLSGLYTGNPVVLPMTGSSTAVPVRFAAPAHTSPEFGAFVLVPLGAPAPSPAPPPSGAAPAGSSRGRSCGLLGLEAALVFLIWKILRGRTD